MNRVYNFAAGPSTMPQEALETAAREMLCYGSTGMSVMEMSHRSKMYLEIYAETEALIRDLMHIPEDYAVMFLQGGATGQFAAIPLNLLSRSADYIDSGNFAHGAWVEAQKYGSVRCVASSREENYVRIPKWNAADFDPNADFFYITTNNTIFGTRYAELPETGSVPLVIVRKDLLGRAHKDCPKIMNWTLMAENDSMLNTPPTYAIYMAGLCMKWLKKQGGVEAIEKVNIEKSGWLYDLLDNSNFYRAVADPASRSRMNVTFTTPDPDLDAKFVKEAAASGLVNLKGHRLTGGIRASIYNAMPTEGVRALVDFMKKFEMENA